MVSKSEVAAIIGVVAILAVVMGIISLVSYFPFIFLLFGDWVNYLYWLPIAINVSRILLAISCILIPLASIFTKKLTTLTILPLSIIMVIWGYPLLLATLVNLATNVLTGLELQRTIITLVTLEITRIGIAVSHTDKYSKKDEKE